MATRLVPSNTEADVTYRVETQSIGGGPEIAYKCQCDGFKFRGSCDHLKKVNANPEAYPEAGMPTGTPPAGVKRNTAIKMLPMLAHVFDPKKIDLKTGRFCVEEKFDGWRFMFEVRNGILSAWSRTGKDMLSKLNSSIRKELMLLPDGVYDGEGVDPREGGKSFSVSTLMANASDQLRIVIFDVLTNGDFDITQRTAAERRTWLEKCFGDRKYVYLTMPKRWIPQSQEELNEAVQEIWSNGGEGMMVKDLKATYAPGKRSRGWLKIKQCQHATLEIIGFVESAGEVVDRGLFAATVLQDGEGNMTVVKTLDDAELGRLNAAAGKGFQPENRVMKIGAKKYTVCINHPWVGRNLLIEYHERTEDNSYRHPRWDRYADE